MDFLKDEFRENHISTCDELRHEIIELCSALHSAELSKEEQLYLFLRIFAILKESKKKGKLVKNILPLDLRRIIDYIDKHINEQLHINIIIFYKSFSIILQSAYPQRDIRFYYLHFCAFIFYQKNFRLLLIFHIVSATD